MTQTEWLSSSDPASLLRWLTGTPGSSPEGATGALAPARRPSERKLRLFACACRRQMPDLRWDGQSQGWADMEDRPEKPSLANSVGPHTIPALEHAELFAGPRLSPDFRPKPEVAADILRDIVGNPLSPVTLPPGPMVKCPARCERVGGHATYRVYESAGPESRWVMCGRCVGAGRVDGPCPWITPDVLSLALAAYEERLPDGTLDNARLAVLSDALEEAGCVGDAAWTCGDDGKHSHGGTASGVYHGVKHDTDPRKPHHHHDEKCPRTHSPHPVLAHLRSAGPHYRGMWSLDLVLGKE